MPIKDLQLDLKPTIKKSDIYARRSILSKMIEGSWVTTFKGRGIEFSGYRKYQYGDDASLIDWKASLRNKEPLVREFEEFKSFKVFLLLDVSESMLFTSTKKLKCEFAAELGYSLADSILKSGDAVGLGMFTDKLIAKVDPNIGTGVIDKIHNELSNGKNYGGKFDLKHVLKQTVSFLKSRAVIIILSDFIGLAKGWERYVRMLGEQYEILAIMIRDPRDRELPKGVGQYSMEDPYSNDYLYVDVNDYADAYMKQVSEEEKRIRKVFEGSKGGFIMIETDKNYLKPLLHFFRKREFVTGTI